MPGADLVRTTYTDLRDLLAAVDETDSWSPTGAEGWCVRDLTYHCTMDAQRALVALHTPTARRPDRDAVSYWEDWGDDPVGAANGRRTQRRICLGVMPRARPAATASGAASRTPL